MHKVQIKEPGLSMSMLYIYNISTDRYTHDINLLASNIVSEYITRIVVSV